MALSITLPLQATQYHSTVNVFTADFNDPEAGKYSFNTAENENQLVLPMEINSYYLIERIFVSGNVASEDFLSSMDEDNLPYIRIRRSKDSVASHARNIPVLQFTQNRESPIWVKSDKKDDTLIMTLRGIFFQIDNTVGIDPLVVTVGLSIYQLNETYFNEAMRTSLLPSFGLDKKRGL
jgi:hypothetical protein